jgi:hypothetical protein
MASIPDQTYLDRNLRGDGLRPSWSANPGFVNAGHQSIFEETREIPG